MTAVITTTGGGQYVIGRRQRFFPVRLGEYEEEPVSQEFVGAAHVNDLRRALELASHPSVDVNFIETVCLRSRKTEIVLNGESSSDVRVEFEEFRTDVTALFLASHNGNISLVRKLLNLGANVNQKLFRGYATTAAVREGHIEVLEILLNGGAAQMACEEAMLEASYLGRDRAAEVLMASDMIRPHVAVHALVVASSRGFVDFVETLIKNGVDYNANARILLQSSKPSLHANVDCNALVAAIVSRQVHVVQLLLKVGCKRDTKVSLGAWSWDTTTGEEFRVGAGLAEPFHVTWCAVEYFEHSGTILRILLHDLSPNVPHLGRTIIHHAILCGNPRAFEVLLSCGADIEFPIQTSQHTDARPLHLASRLGLTTILGLLISAGCNLNSQTRSGDTALMICARYKQDECLKLLASSGSDFGLPNVSGESAGSIAASVRWTHGFQRAVLDVIQAGKIVKSSNSEVFSSLVFATRANDVEALSKLLKQSDLINVDEKDESGFSAVMVAAAAGHVEAFRQLITAGADVETKNKYGESAVSIAQASQRSDAFGKILSAHTYKKSTSIYSGNFPLHNAVRLRNIDSVRKMGNSGHDVNILDSEGYTPLMIAAKLGDGDMCELLISYGSDCDIKNGMHETALSLAREGKGAESVILDELSRRLVLGGACLKKHTKGGKGKPHMKMLKMVEATGVLHWGKSSKRNVICRGAEVGASCVFRWNRKRKNDADDAGLFRVVTTKNKEFYFSCDGGLENAKLWVRGIRLLTTEAIFGRNAQ